MASSSMGGEASNVIHIPHRPSPVPEIKVNVSAWASLLLVSYLGFIGSFGLTMGTKAGNNFLLDDIATGVFLFIGICLTVIVARREKLRANKLIGGTYGVYRRSFGSAIVLFLTGAGWWYTKKSAWAILLVVFLSLCVFAIIQILRPSNEIGILCFCLGTCMTRAADMWSYGPYSWLTWAACVLLSFFRHYRDVRREELVEKATKLFTESLESELTRSITELTQSKTELTQSQIQLTWSQSELTQLQAELTRSQAELSRLLVENELERKVNSDIYSAFVREKRGLENNLDRLEGEIIELEQYYLENEGKKWESEIEDFLEKRWERDCNYW